MHRAVIRIPHPDAPALAAALAPDNGGHLESRVEAGALVLEVGATTPMGALRSLDDALACLRAAGVA